MYMIKKYKIVFAILLILAAFVLPAPSAHGLDKAEIWSLYRDGEASFHQANELMKTDPQKARDFLQKAGLAFERIAGEGNIENGKLYYNIGNIYFRMGDIGKAILYYRRAERLIPNDINLQQNLSYSRSRCLDKIEAKPETRVFQILFFWHYDLSLSTRTWIFLVFFNLIWILAGVSLFRKRGALRYGTIACATLSLLLAGSICVEAYQQSHTRSGVILAKEVTARKGDSATFEPSFKEPLHTGTEFNLVEERKGWYYIELADGRRCWIPDSAAGIL